MPNRGHIDKKKQVALLYSTMLRRMYLKGPMSKTLTDESVYSPKLEKKVTKGVSAIKLEESKSKKEVSGSQRSLFKIDKTGDAKDNDCSIM